MEIISRAPGNASCVSRDPAISREGHLRLARTHGNADSSSKVQASGEHHQSRSQFRSNSRTGKGHSRSRSISFPPFQRSESKERPNQVSWKPQDSQLERENAELRAQLRRQEKEMKQIKEMLQNVLAVKDKSSPPVIQTSSIPRQNISLPPSTTSSRAPSPQRVPRSKGKLLR